MELHRIDVPVGQNNGQTSVSPQNPTNNIATNPPLSPSVKLALGYGALTARTTYQTFTQEVRAGGNEELATDLENIGTGLSTGGLILATKGAAIIPIGIQEAASAITRTRSVARRNREIEYQRSLRGSRVNFNQGRAYE